mmetsp:Transcript_26297/g.47376  ORF Transcript_26297/g.47376 Transcript_26297/m.47376 type:complete len:861 (-) Transcript_26297:120-2702(-)
MAGDEVDATNGKDAQHFAAFLDYLETPTLPNESNPPKDTTEEVRQENNFHDEFIEESLSHAKGTPTTALIIAWIARSFLFFAAFLLALFPSVMKIYETSHWFREGDPSVYDDAKDWFSNPKLPLQSYFDNSKILMRVYFFIIPYILSALCVAVGLIIPAVPSPLSSSNHLQQRRRAIGSFLRRTLVLPTFLVRLGLPLRVSIAEVIGIVIFLTLNIMTIAVRVRRSLPRGSRKIEFLVDSDGDASKDPIDPISWQACEVWAKTLGVISILNLGWYLLMPVGRKSVLLEALNVSWERAIKYHRWVGYYSVAIMVVHGLMYIAIFIHGDGHPIYDPEGVMVESNLNAWYCSRNECDEDQARMLRRNIYGLVTLFLIMVMTVFTLPWIRRQKFEWFFYAHHLFVLVLVFVSLHYKGAIIYLLPGIAIYGVDKLMALYAYKKTAPVATRMLSSDVIEISFETTPGVTYKAGDYVFLNVPSVSFLQWHPYSVTSAPSAHGKKVMFHLKGFSGGWTDQVIKEALKRDDNTLNVRLDGFYGVNNGICDQLRSKDGVILVGGGIGVTPMMSLALELCATSSIPVTIMWVVRTIEEFGIFSTELADARRSYKNFKPKVWCTLSSHKSSPNNDGGAFDRAKLLEFDNFKLALQSIKESQTSKGTMATPAFILDEPSLSGASNATVMTISTIFALIAYALAVKISKKDSHADTPQDFISLMELAMVSLSVVLWIVMVIGVRYVLALVLYPTTKLTTSSATTEEMAAHTVSTGSSGSGSDLEHSKRDDLVLQSIIQGNIGCRPNISNEFSSFARVVAEKIGRPVDIAVLACGPPKMVESINDYINVPSSFFNLGVDKNQQAFFSFIEEDWEW